MRRVFLNIVMIASVAFLLTGCKEEDQSMPNTSNAQHENHHIEKGIEAHSEDFAHVAGVRLLYTKDMTLPTYADFASKIPNMPQNLIESKDGFTTIDLQPNQAIIFPKDKYTSANGKPVLFYCTFSAPPHTKEGKKNRDCNTRLFYKKNLRVGIIIYDHTNSNEYLKNKLDSYLAKVDQFLEANPEFYYNRIKEQ